MVSFPLLLMLWTVAILFHQLSFNFVFSYESYEAQIVYDSSKCISFVEPTPFLTEKELYKDLNPLLFKRVKLSNPTYAPMEVDVFCKMLSPIRDYTKKSYVKMSGTKHVDARTKQEAYYLGLPLESFISGYLWLSLEGLNQFQRNQSDRISKLNEAWGKRNEKPTAYHFQYLGLVYSAIEYFGHHQSNLVKPNPKLDAKGFLSHVRISASVSVSAFKFEVEYDENKQRTLDPNLFPLKLVKKDFESFPQEIDWNKANENIEEVLMYLVKYYGTFIAFNSDIENDFEDRIELTVQDCFALLTFNHEDRLSLLARLVYKFNTRPFKLPASDPLIFQWEAVICNQKPYMIELRPYINEEFPLYKNDFLDKIKQLNARLDTITKEDRDQFFNEVRDHFNSKAEESAIVSNLTIWDLRLLWAYAFHSLIPNPELITKYPSLKLVRIVMQTFDGDMISAFEKLIRKTCEETGNSALVEHLLNIQWKVEKEEKGVLKFDMISTEQNDEQATNKSSLTTILNKSFLEQETFSNPLEQTLHSILTGIKEESMTFLDCLNQNYVDQDFQDHFLYGNHLDHLKAILVFQFGFLDPNVFHDLSRRHVLSVDKYADKELENMMTTLASKATKQKNLIKISLCHNVRKKFKNIVLIFQY